MSRILLTALLIFFQISGEPAVRLRETTAGIAAGTSTTERGAAITDHLKSAGVTFHVEEFRDGTRSGTNIVATIPAKAASRTLLLGAHYDRVARGRGAVDNAASCAVLVELIERLKSKPLSNTTMTIVFFDLEEIGLVGSRSYFQTLSNSAIPNQAINLDIFGYGETFFVSPSTPSGSLMTFLKQAASETGFPIRSIPITQYPLSDHVSMARAGVETIGIALIDGSEIDSVITPGAVPPRILSMIHTDADTMEQVREQDMAKALPVLERTIRLLDATP
jgi:aminopeptidase S